MISAFFRNDSNTVHGQIHIPTENLKTSLSKSFKYNQDQTIEEIKIGGDMDIGGDLTVNEFHFPLKMVKGIKS